MAGYVKRKRGEAKNVTEVRIIKEVLPVEKDNVPEEVYIPKNVGMNNFKSIAIWMVVALVLMTVYNQLKSHAA